MKQLFSFWSVIILILFCTSHFVQAQTYMYKRIMIVTNGNKQIVNDDAHYITFNKKGCYESDKNGISDNGNKFIKFTKDENNLHCYYGGGFYGDAFYYFSLDYSRLNIKTGNSIYVYTQDIPSRTTASLRKKQDNPGGTLLAPVPIIIDDNNNSTPSTKLRRNRCNYCKGTGVDPSPTYGPNYTGKPNSKYCDVCCAVKDSHYHAKCPSCGGKGYYETRY